MKKILIIAFAGLFAASCKKQPTLPAATEPVAKKITFGVYAIKNYDDMGNSPWKNASGTVKLAIEKIDKQSGQPQLVWDTTFVERRLTEYPLQAAKIELTKSISVAEMQEYLHIRQEVVYAVSFMEPQRFGRVYTLEKGTQQLQINVEL